VLTFEEKNINISSRNIHTAKEEKVSELGRLLATCLFEIDKCESLQKLESIRIVVLGKNGKIAEMLKAIRDMSNDEKRSVGAEINSTKDAILRKIEEKTSEIKMLDLEKKLAQEFIDISMPARPVTDGHIHPITRVIEEISEILSSYGFIYAVGPEIESEHMNFTSLNMPDHHPARAMHDTFYINALADENGRKLLRTHTSTVQIRAMLANSAPFRFFSIGRVFRSDYDATHTPMFNQVEGIMVDKNVHFSHLKWMLSDFIKKFFEVDDVFIRFRPSFFPFTEPSVEVDISYGIKDEKIVFARGNRWMEVCGAGMIHPNVLKHGNVDAEKFQGFAFGFGVERLASLKYGIPDLRGYFESDDRWRSAFGFRHASR
jgi:phenylalanyl-tRNA synthetase alpha chain